MLDYQRLRERAKEKRIGLTTLGESLGKSKYYLYDVESKGVRITKDMIEQLAEMLDTTPAYLEGETDSPDIVRNTEEFVDIYRLVNNRPSTKLLFSALKNATDEDIKQTIAILEALKRTNGQQ